jgi:hypothetical protein
MTMSTWAAPSTCEGRQTICACTKPLTHGREIGFGLPASVARHTLWSTTDPSCIKHLQSGGFLTCVITNKELSGGKR